MTRNAGIAGGLAAHKTPARLSEADLDNEAVHALMGVGLLRDPVDKENFMKDVLRHAFMSGQLTGIEQATRLSRRPPPIPVQEAYEHVTIAGESWWKRLVRG